MKTITTSSAGLASAARATCRPTSLLVLCAMLAMAGRSEAGEVAALSQATTARATASAASANRGRAALGDAYAVTRKAGEWVEVQFGRGKVWLKRSDLVVREGATKRVTAESGLRVRSGAGANYATMGALSNGVSVADRGGGNALWTKISFEGKTGWVLSRFLRAESPSAGMVHTIEATTLPASSPVPANVPATPVEDVEADAESEAEAATEAATTVADAEPEAPPAARAPEPVAAPVTRATAWQNGVKIGTIEVVTINGKAVSKRTADAFYRMRDAARQAGVTLSVVSGFRTYDEQAYLYRLYRAGHGNLAARPGHSNHQNGWALDLNTHGPGVYTWLTRNAKRFGFKRTVPSEKWHWEFRG